MQAFTWWRRKDARAESLPAARSCGAGRAKTGPVLCDTSIDGFLAPIEDQRRDLEYRYFVNNPTIRTIEVFAAFITRTNTY